MVTAWQLILAMQQCIDTPLALPWGADLTQNAIEKKQ
jgi:hypothetical protein